MKRHIQRVHVAVVTMSQYKVLPPYSEINTLNQEYEEAASFTNFSLIYSQETSPGYQLGAQQVMLSVIIGLLAIFLPSSHFSYKIQDELLCSNK